MCESTSLSVIIPVYNDPDGLRVTLRSLITQQRSPSFEILVVDNASTDTTPEVITEFESAYPNLVTGLVERGIQSSYAARNKGIERAKGDILVFIDADETVEETYIADLDERFSESAVDYLGCNVEMYIPDGKNTFWARYDVVMGLPIEHYLKTKQFVPTCALAVRNEVFEQVGAFDETLVSGGDKEFGNRVHNAGFQMEYASDIVIRHPARTTLRAHRAKATRIGRGRTQLWQSTEYSPHPVSVGRFFPPSPSRVNDRMQKPSCFLFIYFTEYLIKLIQTKSAITELLRNGIT